MSVIFMIFSIGGAFMSAWFAYQAVIEGSPDTSARRFPPHRGPNGLGTDSPMPQAQRNSSDRTEE